MVNVKGLVLKNIIHFLVYVALLETNKGVQEPKKSNLCSPRSFVTSMKLFLESANNYINKFIPREFNIRAKILLKHSVMPKSWHKSKYPAILGTWYLLLDIII